MAKLSYEGPNAQQIEYWNEQTGPKWVALQDLIDTQIAPLGRRAMDAANLAPGERVLDVGCGCGQSSLELAERVGPTGSVLGVDLSTPMLEQARARARAAGLTHVQLDKADAQTRAIGLAPIRFDEADAQTHAFGAGAYDVVYSRFGVMFFADPDAAFANLRRALRPGGRLAFVCWRTLPENPWMAVPLGAALQHLPPPPIPAPGAPGPFAFADAERVRGILTRAGFAEPRFEKVDEVLSIGGGGDLDATVNFLLQLGPTAAALREAGAEKARVVGAAVRESLVPFMTGDGVRMPSASWVVTAVQP
jgi:ubiquinone/menaquinone biosynthesis C-methylase UbiE